MRTVRSSGRISGGGCTWSWGRVYLVGVGGVYLVPGGVPGGGVPGPRGAGVPGCTWSGGMSVPGGCVPGQGVYLSWWGVCSTGGVPGQVPPPVDRQTPVKT